MEKRFFCANCNEMGHIMSVIKTAHGLSFTEHKLGKDVSCDVFLIANEDLGDMQKLMEENLPQKKEKVTVENEPAKKETKEEKPEKMVI